MLDEFQKFDGVFGPGVYGFFGKYRWLSNFEPALIHVDGVSWKSTEHYYQAMKSTDERVREIIRRAETAGHAKKLGKSIPAVCFDWETINRDIVMKKALEAKYRIPHYRELLKATGDMYLEETNWWKDHYWGVCENLGLNKLGLFTMMQREK